jgi:hypothetical protein
MRELGWRLSEAQPYWPEYSSSQAARGRGRSIVSTSSRGKRAAALLDSGRSSQSRTAIPSHLEHAPAARNWCTTRDLRRAMASIYEAIERSRARQGSLRRLVNTTYRWPVGFLSAGVASFVASANERASGCEWPSSLRCSLGDHDVDRRKDLAGCIGALGQTTRVAATGRQLRARLSR